MTNQELTGCISLTDNHSRESGLDQLPDITIPPTTVKSGKNLPQTTWKELRTKTTPSKWELQP